MLLNSILLQLAASPENPWMSFLPFLLIIVVFYFFMIRPQMKRQKEVRNFREALKKGDKVMTTSGVHGVVNEIGDSWALVEIAPNVKIKVEKAGLVANLESVPQR